MLPDSPYLAEPPWLDPAPVPFAPAARGVQWQRARQLSNLPGSPPGPYSTCPSSAAAGAPLPGAGPPLHAAELQFAEKEESFSRPAPQRCPN